MSLDLRAAAMRMLRHPHYKLLSLLIAIGLWVYVQEGETDQTQLRADVQWVLPAGLVPTDPLPEAVVVTVEGSRSALRRAVESKLEVRIDLSDMRNSRQHIEFPSFPMSGLPAAVQIVRFSPHSVDFELDVVEKRLVKLQPVTIGDPAEGFTANINLEPQVVQVQGPRVAVARLGSVSTKPIDVSGLTEDTAIAVELDLPRSVVLLEDQRVLAKVDVEPVVSSQTFTGVPVHVWKAHGWAPNPAVVTVTLQGSTRALSWLEPEQITAFVHLPDEANQPTYQASHGPKTGVRLRIVQEGGAQLEVTKVEPSTVEVVRQ